MKKFYIAVTVVQDKNESIFTGRQNGEYAPGYYAYVVPCTSSDNMKALLQKIGGLLCANIYPTKKEAAEVVDAWNNSYKANGEYLFWESQHSVKGFDSRH